MEKEGSSKQNEENLVKKTCKELGITQKELANRTGISERAITNWASNRVNPPKSFYKTVELLKKEDELNILKKSLKIINS